MCHGWSVGHSSTAGPLCPASSLKNDRRLRWHLHLSVWGSIDLCSNKVSSETGDLEMGHRLAVARRQTASMIKQDPQALALSCQTDKSGSLVLNTPHTIGPIQGKIGKSHTHRAFVTGMDVGHVAHIIDRHVRQLGRHPVLSFPQHG